ncbi:MAG: hypothetical protein U0R50_01210 [Gaiellales bacterium]
MTRSMPGRQALVVAIVAVAAALGARPAPGAALTSGQLHMWRCLPAAFPKAPRGAAFCFTLLFETGETQIAGTGWAGPGSAPQRPGCLAARWTGSLVASGDATVKTLRGGGSWCRRPGEHGELRFTASANGSYAGLGRIGFRSPRHVDASSLRGTSPEVPLPSVTWSAHLSD